VSERHYSNTGPICPYCEYKHRADEAFYFDEDLTDLCCHSCGKDFRVRVDVLWSWNTRKDEDTP
jgi:hypothetical protein